MNGVSHMLPLVVGGGILIGNSSTFTMNGGEISGNKANSEGGAVHVFDKDCQFFLYDGKITGNTSGDGGALLLGGGYDFRVGQLAYVRGPGYMGSGPVTEIERGAEQ